MKEKQIAASVHTADLISRFLNEELAQAEKDELYAWVSASSENQAFFFKLLDERQLEADAKELKQFDRTTALTAVEKKLQDSTPLPKWNIFHIRSLSAAAILICMAVAAYFWSLDFSFTPAQAIQPGRQAATLILSNGQKLSLPSLADGKLAEESGVSISKTPQGQLVYSAANDGPGSGQRDDQPVLYNTLITARGEQYQVILPDGTRVWLNAASSLRFPSTFVNLSERVVELEGEAFFEVASDKRHPFIVKTLEQEVEVLGTHFNISAYTDEKVTKTTLLLGSVQVRLPDAGKNMTLAPGQQSIAAHRKIELMEGVDIEETVAWKNGYFKFNESLESIMAKISRWYDVEVVYQGTLGTDLEFGAKISRDRDLPALLKIIESTGGVHFKIKGRRVYVTK